MNNFPLIPPKPGIEGAKHLIQGQTLQGQSITRKVGGRRITTLKKTTIKQHDLALN
jgi:hypothetical protein